MSKNDNKAIPLALKVDLPEETTNTPLNLYETYLIKPTGHYHEEMRIAAMIDKRFSESQTTLLTQAVSHLSNKLVTGNMSNFINGLREDSTDFRATSLWWPFNRKPNESNHNLEGNGITWGLFKMLGMTSEEDGESFDDDPGNNFFRRKHYYRGLQIGYFDDSSDGAPVGLGSVNSYCQFSIISIAINNFYIGSDSEYFQSQNHKYFAGVIAHELLHNLGWRHLSGDRKRAFIYQYQAWISDDSLNLTDTRLAKTCAFE